MIPMTTIQTTPEQRKALSQNINDLLLSTEYLAQKWEKENRAEQARELRNFTSQYTLLQINLFNLKQDYKKVVCHCGNKLTQGIEVDTFNKTGDCFTCEKVRTDAMLESYEEEDNE